MFLKTLVLLLLNLNVTFPEYATLRKHFSGSDCYPIFINFPPSQMFMKTLGCNTSGRQRLHKCNFGNVQIRGAEQILCSPKLHLPDENGDGHPIRPIILLCRLVRPMPIFTIGCRAVHLTKTDFFETENAPKYPSAPPDQLRWGSSGPGSTSIFQFLCNYPGYGIFINHYRNCF